MTGECEPGEEAMDTVQRLRPDVVLMTLSWPARDPVVVCQEIRDRVPSTKVLIMSCQDWEDEVLISVLAEASGYVSQNADGPELAHAIRTVASGGDYFDRETVRRVIGRIRAAMAPDQSEPVPDVLTDREVTVLRMVGEGLKNPEIGLGLNIATTTVRNHIINIRGKLGLSSRSRLVSYAARRGILMTEDHNPT